MIVKKMPSASLWGCELKCPCYFSNWYQHRVSLLVRLWVEISFRQEKWYPLPSASLWGCELKCYRWTVLQSCSGQPPCEAVSWNPSVFRILRSSPASASLWGCELKCNCRSSKASSLGSASLWGCELKFDIIEGHIVVQKSASLWGCELKC